MPPAARRTSSIRDERGGDGPGLIVTKLVSFRPQDQEDIRALLAANRDDIDVGTIRREWAAVALGEDSRTSWLESELAALFPGR